MGEQTTASDLLLLQTRYDEDEAKRRAFQPPNLSNGRVTPYQARKMLEADVWVLSEELALRDKEHAETTAALESKLAALAAAGNEKEALLEQWESQLLKARGEKTQSHLAPLLQAR